MFSIGQLSRATGVKIPTIRFYESKDLIACNGRTSGNQRRYDQAGLDRLTFIKHARDLGLPLDSIRELIRMQTQPKDHAETHQIATDHLGTVRDRIARLESLEAELSRIIASCDGGRGHDCSILHAFARHDLCKSEH